MFKICIIGAASFFSREIIKDILCVKEFQNTVEIVLYDINEKNLDFFHKLIERDVRSNNLSNKIIATTDRLEALKQAKYVFNFTRIGGIAAFQTDIEIPLKYKVDQCVGDTLCAGGIMYGQRGISVMLDICKDIKQVACKDVLFLNFGNPNVMLTWAINHFGGVKCIGLCHGVYHTLSVIAKVLKVDEKEIEFMCSGINHQTWFTKISHKGRQITKDELLEAFEKDEFYSKAEKCRIDMLRRFGYFSTETNGHLSEYLPWYRKNPDDILNWVYIGDCEFGETGGYLREAKEYRNSYETDKQIAWDKGPRALIYESMTNEHCVHIIKALETDYLYKGHFNVVNDGCISNLPDDAIIEVRGYVDRNGINIPYVGDLPLGCAAVCNRAVDVQRLAVHAAVSGDDKLLRQAFMMDPLVGAVCTPPEIWQMVDEMLVAQERWLPQYKDAIAAAKLRLADKSKLIPVDEIYKGGALRKQD